MLIFGIVAGAIGFWPGPAAQAPARSTALSGRVVAGTSNEAKPVRRARVTLSGKGLVTPRVADTDAKGAYRFERVPPGTYRISFSKPGFVRFETDPAPGATHTMARGGAIEGMVPVDFRTRDVEGVEVILTPKVSRIAGVVSDDKGPVPSYAVVIFASDPTKWTDRSRFVAVVRPTQQGSFELRGLPPEDYLAVALPGVTGTEWMDPEFLQQLRVGATSFVLSEGESRTLALKLKKRP